VLGVLAVHADPVSERSIFRLDTTWTDDGGKPMKLGDLRGAVQVVTFFYTTCESACPLTVKALQAVARHGASKTSARYLLITVDPERDTLAALRQYRHKMHIAPGWKLLRGANTDVRRLAALLGFNYEQIASGEFVHSNLVTVLNPHGEVVPTSPRI
jgi:protein SCO1/2